MKNLEKSFLHPIFSQVQEKLEQSKFHEMTWPQDGEVVFGEYNQTTWVAVCEILQFIVTSLFEKGVIMKVPQIYAGPNGSYDIYWNINFNFTILLNVEDGGKRFSYYYEKGIDTLDVDVRDITNQELTKFLTYLK